jgi:type I restriction enzyme M protein
MPENLFYNTTAPGIILVLNKNKAKARNDKILLLNASQEFEKGRPKNFIPDEKIQRVANAFHEYKDVERFAKVISLDEVVKNDYNLSPSRYVETGTGEEYKDIPSLLTELGKLEEESKRLDKELVEVFEKLGLQAN